MAHTDTHVLLITGVPGIGKTTVIRRVAEALADSEVRGFFTAEIRKEGERRGFRLVDFSGRESIIAHVEFSKMHRVGKYGVDVAAIDEAACSLAPDPSAQIYLVDEIGKMECLSDRFVDYMRALLNGPKPVVATVGQRGGGLIAEVKDMRHCLLWEVTRDNRDKFPGLILDWLVKNAGMGTRDVAAKP
jgi:nucleoside-triphosphatase